MKKDTDSDFHIPKTISKEAQRFLRSFTVRSRNAFKLPDDPAHIATWKRTWHLVENYQHANNEAVTKEYRPTLRDMILGDITALDIKPRKWKDNGKVIVYTHGGGYCLGSARGSLTHSVPVAHDTGMRVISVDYTVAPLAQFDEITDQAVNAIVTLTQSGYRLKDIAVYGDSAGGALIAGAVLKMRDRGLGMPAAAILVSPWSDISERGDTPVTLRDADPLLAYPRFLSASAAAYAAPKDWKDPYVSPVYANYKKGFPPTLIQGGTKEILLSSMVRHYQALDQAGCDVKLDLYEGMWHVFQSLPWDLPESKLARKKMASFLQQHLYNNSPEAGELLTRKTKTNKKT